MPYYTNDDEDVDDFDEFDPTPYSGGYDITVIYGRPMRLVTLSPPVSTTISNTSVPNSHPSMILLLTAKKLSTLSTVAILDPSHDPLFDPIQAVVVTCKAKDLILVTDLDPDMVENRNRSMDLEPDMVGNRNRDTVGKRRWSMVGDLNLDTVADRRLDRSMDLVEELRLSMDGDLNLDTVVDRRRKPGMKRNRVLVKRGVSMSVNLAMVDLKNKKKVTENLAMADLRNKRKEATGNLAMADLRRKKKVIESLAMEDLRKKKKVIGSLAMEGPRNKKVTGSLVMGRNKRKEVTGSRAMEDLRIRWRVT